MNEEELEINNNPDLKYVCIPRFISRSPYGIVRMSNHQNQPGCIKYIVSKEKENNEYKRIQELQKQYENQQIENVRKYEQLLKLTKDLQDNLITREEFYKKIPL